MGTFTNVICCAVLLDSLVSVPRLRQQEGTDVDKLMASHITPWLISIPTQSINILFYVCSHRGDIRPKTTTTKKHIIIIYTNFPTGL